MNTHGNFYHCEICGAILDPGEKCDCQKQETMTVTIPGAAELTGTPETIVDLMSRARRFDEPKPAMEYIDQVARDVFRTRGIGINPTGETAQEKSKSFLQEMQRVGLLNIEEETK